MINRVEHVDRVEGGGFEPQRVQRAQRRVLNRVEHVERVDDSEMGLRPMP